MTSRTAASLNSGEYLPRLLDTIPSDLFTPIYLGPTVRKKSGTSRGVSVAHAGLLWAQDVLSALHILPTETRPAVHPRLTPRVTNLMHRNI